jgi:tripartite-type tricarboxylate transporter receptor subunit TctC
MAMKKKVWMMIIPVLFVSLMFAGCTKSTTEETKSSDVAQKTTEAGDSQGVMQPEGYPEKNIEFLLPIPAGGMVDVAMRSLADAVDFGVPVVVINRPGAGQTIGLSEVVTKSFNPHIVTAAGFAGFMIQPNMINLPYSIDDFRYIGINHPPEPQIIVSSADSKFQTWKDVVTALKAGEEVTYSAPNPNGFGRIVMLEVMSQEDISPKFIPFTGSAEGFAALLGGHIDFYIIDASVAVPRIKEKQFNGLMVAGPDRLTKVPEVPNAEELGLSNMEKLVGYTTIAVSKETPDEIVNWLKLKIDEAQQSEAYTDYLKTVVGAEEPLKLYTEKEVTDMVYSTYEVITKNMVKFGLSSK